MELRSPPQHDCSFRSGVTLLPRLVVRVLMRVAMTVSAGLNCDFAEAESEKSFISLLIND